LIFDGDDTLWENNIYFERATADFIDWLDHAHLSRDEVRAVLDEIEHVNIGVHGYGSVMYGHSLRETAERLRNEELSPDELATILAFAERISSHPMELIDDVESTLSALHGHHRLLLLTKGQREEQEVKIARSGLTDLFDAAIVAPEKDIPTYQAVVVEHGLDPAQTWMIGNSPKSDINPALAVGMHAVFIPHAETWRMEHQDLSSAPDGQRFLTVERFAGLLDHFGPARVRDMRSVRSGRTDALGGKGER
jgi:putative hydrolase of the HAD superfamily